MSSVANTVLVEALARVATQLGSSFSQHSRPFVLETLPARELENGYSGLFQDATEDIGLELNRLNLTRTLTVNITYRTFSTATDSKSRTVMATALENEEKIIKDLRLHTFVTANGRIVDIETSSLRTFTGADDSYLLNEINFKSFYRVE